jgi:hypothetical protein
MDVVIGEGFALSPGLLQVEVVRVNNYYFLESAGHGRDDISQEEMLELYGTKGRYHNVFESMENLNSPKLVDSEGVEGHSCKN